MKCICGFDEQSPENQTEKYGYGNKRILGPKEEFIRINGGFNIDNPNNYYGGCIRAVSLYACPKCFTVKMVD